jgi:hypothetical protein
MLHNASYDFNDDLIPLGATCWVELAEQFLNGPNPPQRRCRMIPIPAAFSGSYAEARTKFLEGAASLGLRIHSHLHPLKGRDGETLAMDVVRDGPADADRLLIVSSACHGVEGYCGSGVQVAALADAEWREKARAQGVAVLYIHALNPYGFSHIRSVTQENVDLNRNFHDFSQALPVNTAYRDVQPLLLPEYWPPGQENLGPHACIAPARASSCGVRAALDDAARVHHQNLVRIHHGGEAVRNHQRGLVLRQRFAARPGWRARWPNPARWWPRRRSGWAGSSAACAQWPRAAFRRPRA